MNDDLAFIIAIICVAAGMITGIICMHDKDTPRQCYIVTEK